MWNDGLWALLFGTQILELRDTITPENQFSFHKLWKKVGEILGIARKAMDTLVQLWSLSSASFSTATTLQLGREITERRSVKELQNNPWWETVVRDQLFIISSSTRIGGHLMKAVGARFRRDRRRWLFVPLVADLWDSLPRDAVDAESLLWFAMV